MENGIYYISNAGFDFTGSIYNSVGRLIKTITNANEFSLTNYSDGLYFYRFLDSENRLFSGKIIHLKK